MSSTFTYLKGNCPICSGLSRECRQSKRTNIVHCRGQINSIPSGWISRGLDAWGFEMYIESSDQQDSSEWSKRQQDLAIKRKRSKEELTKGALSAPDRDRAVRRIHKSFGLSRNHHQNLRDRGLSESHIESLPYFSFHDHQEVPQLTPANLPGVRRGRLAVKESGFACPIPNIDGLIVGWQNRFDDETNGKYRWPSGEKTSHLPNGELPIGVYRPDNGVTRQAIGHSEGFLKADITAQNWGLPVIGAASANFAVSPEQWRLSLKRLSVELETQEIHWFADAGSVRNPQVVAQYRKAWDKLKEWGYSVYVVWYDQVDKSIGDADEISQEVRDSSRLIGIAGYLEIAYKYGAIKDEERLDREEPNPVEYEEWEKWELEQERINEAQPLENFRDWLKQKARRSKRFAFWKNGVESSGKECPEIASTRNEIKFNPEKPFPSASEFLGKEPPKIIFKEGERLKVIAAAKEAGWKTITDRSFMGLGKSYDAGRLFPDSPAVDAVDNEGNSEKKNTVWYLDLNHTNASTATVEEMKNLPSRHDGMVAVVGKETPSGQPHLRWRKPEEVPLIPSLCHEADLFVQLAQKGYDVNAAKELIEDDNGKVQQRNKICKKCPFAGKCHLEVGEGYGYLFKRIEALKASRIRASIESVPRENYDYSSDIAFVEEASRYLSGTKSLSAGESEINNLWAMVERKAPEAFSKLQSLRFALQDAFEGEFSKIEKGVNRGTDHDALLENLPSIFSIGIPLSSEYEQAIDQAIDELIAQVSEATPGIEEIVEEPDSVTGLGGKWRQVGNFARNAFRAEAHQKTEENIENLPPNILIDFLEIWSGRKPGALRINGKKLTVTCQDTHQAEILGQMKFVDLLDATGDKKHIAKILMVEPEAILEIEQERPQLDNLQIVNVNMKGMGSSQISNDCKQRQEAFLKWVEEQHWDADVRVLSLKASHLEIDGHWFHDNRSTNAFKGTDVIVAFHTPRINLGVAQDEYRSLYGSLEGFADYYNKLIRAEMIQLVGRQRAHQYPDRKFILYIVGTNQDVSYLKTEYGIQVTNREAVDLCVDAGSAGERTFRRIIDAAQAIMASGKSINEVTQQEIANQIGKCQKSVSKTIAKACGGWVNFKSLVLSLLGIYREGTSQVGSVPKAELSKAELLKAELLEAELLEAELSHEYAKTFANILLLYAVDSPEDLIKELAIIVRHFGLRQLNRILNLVRHEERVAILVKVLVPVMGSKFAQIILADAGSPQKPT